MHYWESQGEMSKNINIKRRLWLAFIALLFLFIFSVKGRCDIKPANRFTHISKVFSIIPPEGFNQGIPREDGVQFINTNDNSFLDISFSFATDKFSDSELIGRFTDEAFREEFIKGLEQNTSSMNARVVSSKEISVNGISAWEFVAQGVTAKGAFENRFIILYRNKKSFLVLSGGNKNSLDSKKLKLIEESLSTIDIK
jgi:hypothetical protein